MLKGLLFGDIQHTINKVHLNGELQQVVEVWQLVNRERFNSSMADEIVAKGHLEVLVHHLGT